MWFTGYSHLPSEMHIQLGSPSPSRQKRRRQCRVGARWRALACAGDADGYGGGGGVVPGSLVLLVVDCRGVSINGGNPIAGWFISWNIPRKNGWFRGTPISGNLHFRKPPYPKVYPQVCFGLVHELGIPIDHWLILMLLFVGMDATTEMEPQSISF